mmetsp:Transcript_77108/g.249566  ORF Transcript_77108/g.249566 Transcript_77108/m.249566 type:complete len:251 (-) Transcript_77108:917-1669(-)
MGLPPTLRIHSWRCSLQPSLQLLFLCEPLLLRLLQRVVVRVPLLLEGHGVLFLQGHTVRVRGTPELVVDPLHAFGHPLQKPPGQDLGLSRACRSLQVRFTHELPVPRELLEAPVGTVATELAFDKLTVDLLGNILTLLLGGANILGLCVFTELADALRKLITGIADLGVGLIQTRLQEDSQCFSLCCPVDVTELCNIHGQVAHRAVVHASPVGPHSLLEAEPQLVADDRRPCGLDGGHSTRVDGLAILGG